MTECAMRKLEFSMKLLLIAAASVAVTSSAQTNTTPASPATQSAVTAPSAATLPVFDVASIRQDISPPSAHNSIYNGGKSGNFRAVNESLSGLLEFAFDMPETRIIGGPTWLKSINFDIEAKADPAIDARMSQLTFDQAKVQKQQMLQALLADRFKLTVHRETRELPVYALVIAKGGAKLAPFLADGTTISTGNEHITVQGGGDNTVAVLAAQLAKSRDVGRIVFDKTGIMGRYDITLKWTSYNGASPMTNNASGDSGPSIFTAIQEQLGLKLESTKGPVQVLVIDRAEMPSEN
jgi:uncharacterized protein (TIGR03435 family)